jgi:hypothetical protein
LLERSMDVSFGLLRSYARRHDQKLSDLARAVIDRLMDAGDLAR